MIEGLLPGLDVRVREQEESWCLEDAAGVGRAGVLASAGVAELYWLAIEMPGADHIGVTARPSHPDQPIPQIIRTSGLVARNQARDMIEAIGEYARVPAPDSPAMRERAALKRKGTVAATRYYFYLRALSQARMRVAAVYDQMVSMGRLLNEDGASLFAHIALARNGCEAAVRVHWLMDPDIGEYERIVRSAVSWYNGMQDHLRGAKALPAGHPARPPERLQQLRDNFTAYLAKTAEAGMSTVLNAKGKNIVAFELDTVRVPVAFNVSEQMASCLPDAPSWYAIGSAATHGSVWTLKDAVAGGETDDCLRMSPDLTEMGAAAWSVLSAAALVIRTYAEYYGHSPKDRLIKLDGRRRMLNRLLMDVVAERIGPV